MKERHLLSLAVVLYIIAMITLGEMPSIAKSETVRNNDKLLHFGEFFILGILLVKTLESYEIKNYYILAFLIAFLIVWVSEFVQLLIPSRSFSYKDMLADTLGV